ncbi:MAG: hypothetical protein ACXIU7_00330 [Roseinatronobacter sp.]
MKPNFALGLTDDGITLWQRGTGGWLRVGAVALEHPDLDGAMHALVARARDLAPEGLLTKLVIPEEQILALSLPIEARSRELQSAEIRRQLVGRTPYPVTELDFDWADSNAQAEVLVVARETIIEAEDFARAHGLNPVCAVAAPTAASFDREPFFGTTRMARELLESRGALVRDHDILREVGHVAPPAAAPADPDATAAADPAVTSALDDAAETAPARTVPGAAAAGPGDAHPSEPTAPKQTSQQTLQQTLPPQAPASAPEAGSDPAALRKAALLDPLRNGRTTDSAPPAPGAEGPDTRLLGQDGTDQRAVRTLPAGGADRDQRDPGALREAAPVSPAGIEPAPAPAVDLGAFRSQRATASVVGGAPTAPHGAPSPARTSLLGGLQSRMRGLMARAASADPGRAAAGTPETPVPGTPTAPSTGPEDLSGGTTEAGRDGADPKAVAAAKLAVSQTAPLNSLQNNPQGKSRKRAKGKAALREQRAAALKAEPARQGSRPAPASGEFARPSQAMLEPRKDPIETPRSLRNPQAATDEAERLTVFGARGNTMPEPGLGSRVLLVLGGVALLLAAVAIWAFYFLNLPDNDTVADAGSPPLLSLEDPGESLAALPAAVDATSDDLDLDMAAEIEAALGLEDAAEQLPLDMPMSDADIAADAGAGADIGVGSGAETEAETGADAAAPQDGSTDTGTGTGTGAGTATAFATSREQQSGRVAGLRSTTLLPPQDPSPLPAIPEPPAPFGSEPLPPLRDDLALTPAPGDADTEGAAQAVAAPDAAPETPEDGVEITVTEGTPAAVPPVRPASVLQEPDVDLAPLDAQDAQDVPEDGAAVRPDLPDARTSDQTTLALSAPEGTAAPETAESADAEIEVTVTTARPAVVPPARPLLAGVEAEPLADPVRAAEADTASAGPALAETAAGETVLAAPAQDAVSERDDIVVAVIEARPPAAPPTRPGAVNAQADPADGAAGTDAIASPSDLSDNDLPADPALLAAPSPGGVALSALVRPAPRPAQLAAPQDEPAAQPEPEITGSALAVAQSPRPEQRPDQFAAVVQRALRAAQPRETTAPAQIVAAAPAPAPTPVSAAPAATAPAPPPIPSSANVAQAATQARAINLRQVNLIGVMGTASNRRALVRLANGRVVMVRVGDALDNGRVTAIGESELRYDRRGRNVVLRIAS